MSAHRHRASAEKVADLVLSSCQSTYRVHTEAFIVYEAFKRFWESTMTEAWNERLVYWLLSDRTTCLPRMLHASPSQRPSACPCREAESRLPMLDGRYKVVFPDNSTSGVLLYGRLPNSPSNADWNDVGAVCAAASKLMPQH